MYENLFPLNSRRIAMFRRLVLAALLVLGMLKPSVQAQLFRGYISGTISDEQNAVIAGVSITITNLATNISKTSVSNESGFYRFAAVEPGGYSIEFGRQ